MCALRRQRDAGSQSRADAGQLVSGVRARVLARLLVCNKLTRRTRFYLAGEHKPQITRERVEPHNGRWRTFHVSIGQARVDLS